MQQRVKLAVALVHDPSLLLLDEPTDGMDPQGREDMLDLIARIRDELGIDVLVSTHLLGDVERVCDRVVMVHDAGRWQPNPEGRPGFVRGQLRTDPRASAPDLLPALVQARSTLRPVRTTHWENSSTSYL